MTRFFKVNIFLFYIIIIFIYFLFPWVNSPFSIFHYLLEKGISARLFNHFFRILNEKNQERKIHICNWQKSWVIQAVLKRFRIINLYEHSIIRESEDQMDKVNISTITITNIKNSNQNWFLCSARYMCLIHSSPHMIYEKIPLTTFYGHKQTTFIVLNNLSSCS